MFSLPAVLPVHSTIIIDLLYSDHGRMVSVMITHIVTVLWKFCVVKELTDIYAMGGNFKCPKCNNCIPEVSHRDTRKRSYVWVTVIAGHGNADRLVVDVQLFLLDLLCAKQACPVKIIGEISRLICR